MYFVGVCVHWEPWMLLPRYFRAPCFVEFYTQLNFMLIKFFNEFLLLAGQVGFASTLDGLLWSNPSDSSLVGLAKSFLQLTVGCSLVRDFSAYSNKWTHRKHTTPTHTCPCTHAPTHTQTYTHTHTHTHTHSPPPPRHTPKNTRKKKEMRNDPPPLLK